MAEIELKAPRMWYELMAAAAFALAAASIVTHRPVTTPLAAGKTMNIVTARVERRSFVVQSESQLLIEVACYCLVTSSGYDVSQR